MGDFIAVIPSRYASTRFPAKALADIHGKPMVIRVAEQALASGAKEVIVATDDDRIMKALNEHGIRGCMTRADHETGTDRLAEVVDTLGFSDDEIIVNVQGDEPLIEPDLIANVAQLLASQPECAMATAAYQLADAASLWNPNVVKVVVNQQQQALYFSRAPIPWARDHVAAEQQKALPEKTLPTDCPFLHHIGIYAYRAGFLKAYPQLCKADIEHMESLEQLRALWHGYRIAVHLSNAAPAPGVDDPDDLKAVLARWPQSHS